MQQALVLGLIGFVVGKITATFLSPLFPNTCCWCRSTPPLAFAAIALAICVLASVLAIAWRCKGQTLPRPSGLRP